LPGFRNPVFVHKGFLVDLCSNLLSIICFFEIRMVNSLRMFGMLFAATFIFLIGNGLLNTLISTRLAVSGSSPTATGIVLSSYFTGLLVGSFVCSRLIQGIGHIRAFAVFGALTTATTLLCGLYPAPWFWVFLRFTSGIVTFGIFMVIESWLNECSESRFRGRVFAVYMTLSYTGIAIGQQLLNFGDIEGQVLFTIAGIVLSLSLVPVAVTRGVHPRLPEIKPYRFIDIFRKAPLGMLGCLAAGLTNSTFYTLTPVFCTAIGLSLQQLSLIMSLTVFCGLASQWLLGSVSDRFDRTLVLAVVAIALTGVSAAMFLAGYSSFGVLAFGMGIFGAFVFAIYPLAVARAHDVFGGKDVVAVSASLLFAYSIGACVSPLIASGAMTLTGSPFGIFAFWAVIGAILAVVTLYLRKHENVAVVPVEDQLVFVPMKSSSPVIMALEPMIEAEEDTNVNPVQRDNNADGQDKKASAEK
jgi:MFS family permease